MVGPAGAHEREEMFGPLKKMYVAAHGQARALNLDNIRELVQAAKPQRSGRLLDLGCHDGAWSMELARACGIEEVHGVEVVEEAAIAAEARGLVVHREDLNGSLSIEDETFDIVHSNQVIEHVSDVDHFVSEIYRILRPGGHAIVSTENGSSWHNVAAAIMGWQIFSLTNVSGKVAGLGNPFAVHRNTEAFSKTWRHKTIMNYRGLVELFEVHGFEDVRVRGAGYYPLPATLGSLDPRHAAFLTVLARKPSS